MVVVAAQMQFASARSVLKHFFGNLTILFQDVIENSDWNKCLDINGMSLARCIYNCDDNGDCETDCVTQFKGRTMDCPCEVGKITHFTI